MTNEERLAIMVDAFGSLQDIPWGTMYGQIMTLGTMTDEHVDNCIQYHQGLVMIAEVTPEYRPLLEEANFIVFMQTKNKESRM
jgi:hypothetical protein